MLFELCSDFSSMQADVLEYYDQTVNSPNGSFYIPAVLRVCFILCFISFSYMYYKYFHSKVALYLFLALHIPLCCYNFSPFQVPHLLQVVKRRRVKNSLSRKNILHRDNYTCQ